MEVYDDLKSLRACHPHCVATIGKYDGMHLGHQMILGRLKQLARARDLPSLVILSEPQPEEFFSGSEAPARLLSFEDKIHFLQGQAIDLVFKMTFDRALSELSPDDFIEQVLVEGLGVKALVIGDDFRFGCRRAGDFTLLQTRGQQWGFCVEAAETCLLEGQRVSSTLLREKLEAGDCEAVQHLLGRPYQLRGKVVQGQQLGRQLGYPTANITVGMEQLAIEGIFIATAEFDGRSIEGVASVGYKPSIAGSHGLYIEIHLFDFDESLYGKTLGINFLKKIRDQESFADLAALKSKIQQDIDLARSYFRGEV